MPPNAWDSHMHVTDPLRFPISKNATYKPHPAILSSALANARQLNIPNLVFVQPSTYGVDNACLLHALETVGLSRGRGVVVIDPENINFDTLDKWHALGVRGVRLNLKSVNKTLPREELARVLRAYAGVVRPMKTWALQLYVDLAIMDDIEPLLPELGIKMVFDHYGHPSSLTPPLSEIPGWNALLRMMQSQLVYVKISAPYRLSKDPEYKDLEVMSKELFQVREGRGVVFASDWPHTRFEGVDITPFVKDCLEWCAGDEKLKNNLFRDNARELWDID